MIRVIRTIEYEYADFETALKDVEAWQVGHRWQEFGPSKRARSRVTQVLPMDRPSPVRAENPPESDTVKHHE